MNPVTLTRAYSSSYTSTPKAHQSTLRVYAFSFKIYRWSRHMVSAAAMSTMKL